MMATVLGAVVAALIVAWAIRAYRRRSRIIWGHRYSMRQEHQPDISTFSADSADRGDPDS